ncbi:hypothetical protein HY643_01335 [Candidatus Woesearchaeota archaeon]|nr:hypothetical protein [Candidatus Woesearchaeota archaeon]
MGYKEDYNEKKAKIESLQEKKKIIDAGQKAEIKSLESLIGDQKEELQNLIKENKLIVCDRCNEPYEKSDAKKEVVYELVKYTVHYPAPDYDTVEKCGETVSEYEILYCPKCDKKLSEELKAKHPLRIKKKES